MMAHIVLRILKFYFSRQSQISSGNFSACFIYRESMNIGLRIENEILSRVPESFLI
jgi:hypothetical protein